LGEETLVRYSKPPKLTTSNPVKTKPAAQIVNYLQLNANH